MLDVSAGRVLRQSRSEVNIDRAGQVTIAAVTIRLKSMGQAGVRRECEARLYSVIFILISNK